MCVLDNVLRASVCVFVCVCMSNNGRATLLGCRRRRQRRAVNFPLSNYISMHVHDSSQQRNSRTQTNRHTEYTNTQSTHYYAFNALIFQMEIIAQSGSVK